MIAPKTGMDSPGPLKCVDESRGRQRIGAEPAAQIEKSSGNAQDNHSNAHESSQHAASSQGRWLFFRRSGRVTRQRFAPMPGTPTFSWGPVSTFERLITYTLGSPTCNAPYFALQVMVRTLPVPIPLAKLAFVNFETRRFFLCTDSSHPAYTLPQDWHRTRASTNN